MLALEGLSHGGILVPVRGLKCDTIFFIIILCSISLQYAAQSGVGTKLGRESYRKTSSSGSVTVPSGQTMSFCQQSGMKHTCHITYSHIGKLNSCNGPNKSVLMKTPLHQCHIGKELWSAVMTLNTCNASSLQWKFWHWCLNSSDAQYYKLPLTLQD